MQENIRLASASKVEVKEAPQIQLASRPNQWSPLAIH
jgi:hypothetical protein